MSNTHIPVRLKTNLRRLDTAHLANEVTRYQSTITSEPTVIGQQKTPLTIKEKNVVHQALLAPYINSNGSAVELNKSDLLLQEGGRDPRLGTTRFSAILTVYDGEVLPPTELEDLDYNAVFPSPETDDELDDPVPRWFELTSFKPLTVPVDHSKASRRWLRVHAMECDGHRDEHDQGNPIFSTEGIKFYLFTLELTLSIITLHDALKLSCCTDTLGHVHSAPLPHFQGLSGAIDDDAGRPYTALEKPPKVQDFPGILAVTEPTFHVHPGPNNDLFLSADYQTTVQLDANFTTIADFVTKHCRGSLGSLQSPAAIAMLETKLKGVHVRFSRLAGSITGFKIGTAADVPAFNRHHAWPSQGSLLLSPELPLVNLGTLDKPQYLPMEVCQMLPGQKLRGPRDVGLSHYVNTMSQDQAWQSVPIQSELVDASLIFHHVPWKRPSKFKERLVEACNGNVPNLLFVEAGLTTVRSQEWRDLRAAIVTCLRQSLQDSGLAGELPKSGDNTPLLSLRSKSGHDPSSCWTRQLQEFVTHNATPGRKAIAVVWLESQDGRNMMYDIIKKACDVKACAQTFFVKRASYESRLHAASADFKIVSRTAADIRRRICQKNPRVLTKTNNGDEFKLVIAMHVAKISNPKQHNHCHAKQGRESELYVVTLVSRDITRSEKFHTERAIYNKSQMDDLAYTSLVKAFADLLPSQKPRSIVLLRSGHIGSAVERTDLRYHQSDSSDSTILNKHGGSVTNQEVATSSQEPLVQSTTVTAEIQAIKTILKLSAPDVFTYITLTEDTILRTHLLDLEAHSLKRLDDDSPAVFFIHNSPLANAKERSIAVQQLQSVPSKDDSKEFEVRPLMRHGAITATFYRHPQVTDASSDRAKSQKGRHGTMRGAKPAARDYSRPNLDPFNKPIAQRPSYQKAQSDPVTPSPRRRKSTGTDSPKPDLTDDTAEDRSEMSPTPSMAPENEVETTARDDKVTPAKITRSEIDLLAAVWKDDALGLYTTKWPVPTHLARLAAKRAMMHLCTNEWHQVSKEDSADVFLPEVHTDVRDTLYYL